LLGHLSENQLFIIQSIVELIFLSSASCFCICKAAGSSLIIFRPAHPAERPYFLLAKISRIFLAFVSSIEHCPRKCFVELLRSFEPRD
jgi:hypothetical protein